jgi:hypothetical protein
MFAGLEVSGLGRLLEVLGWTRSERFIHPYKIVKKVYVSYIFQCVNSSCHKRGNRTKSRR